jgi:hypothetical protein
MNRRDFIKLIAVMSAGTAALPQQIAAFETFYLKNSPLLGEPFICLDEVSISGLATDSAPVRIDIFDGDENVLPCGLNAFGGVYFWRAGPEHKIVMPSRKAMWKVGSPYDDAWIKTHTSGYFSYIDQDGIRVKKLLKAVEGFL